MWQCNSLGSCCGGCPQHSACQRSVKMCPEHVCSINVAPEGRCAHSHVPTHVHCRRVARKGGCCVASCGNCFLLDVATLGLFVPCCLCPRMCGAAFKGTCGGPAILAILVGFILGIGLWIALGEGAEAVLRAPGSAGKSAEGTEVSWKGGMVKATRAVRGRPLSRAARLDRPSAELSASNRLVLHVAHVTGAVFGDGE